MSSTLTETLRQIDPYVSFSDGTSITTAGKLLTYADPSDHSEYALGSDGQGRLIIYRLDDRGYAISPPVFVEHKIVRPQTDSNQRSADFGMIAHRFV